MMTEDLDTELRRVFAHAGAATDVPESVRARLTGREYHPRQVRRGWAGGVGTLAIATAASVAIPLATGNGAAPRSTHTAAGPGATLSLDSYQFALPRGYRPTHGQGCSPGIAVATTGTTLGFPKGTHRVTSWLSEPLPVPVLATIPKSTKLTSAASADGGCVFVALLLPYRPTRRIPDPFVRGFEPAEPVRIADHRGVLISFSGRNAVRSTPTVTFAIIEVPAHPSSRDWPIRESTELELFVQLPGKGGLVNDLVVGSTALTVRQLISIVRRGLAHPLA